MDALPIRRKMRNGRGLNSFCTLLSVFCDAMSETAVRCGGGSCNTPVSFQQAASKQQCSTAAMAKIRNRASGPQSPRGPTPWLAKVVQKSR